MKKSLFFMVLLALVFGLGGCGKKEKIWAEIQKVSSQWKHYTYKTEKGWVIEVFQKLDLTEDGLLVWNSSSYVSNRKNAKVARITREYWSFPLEKISRVFGADATEGGVGFACPGSEHLIKNKEMWYYIKKDKRRLIRSKRDAFQEIAKNLLEGDPQDLSWTNPEILETEERFYDLCKYFKCGKPDFWDRDYNGGVLEIRRNPAGRDKPGLRKFGELMEQLADCY